MTFFFCVKQENKEFDKEENRREKRGIYQSKMKDLPSTVRPQNNAALISAIFGITRFFAGPTY